MATNVTSGVAPIDKTRPGKTATRVSWEAILAGVTLILTLYLLTSAVGGVIGGAFRTVGAAAGTSFILVLALLIGAAAAGFGATTASRRRLR